MENSLENVKINNNVRNLFPSKNKMHQQQK